MPVAYPDHDSTLVRVYIVSTNVKFDLSNLRRREEARKLAERERRERRVGLGDDNAQHVHADALFELPVEFVAWLFIAFSCSPREST